MTKKRRALCLVDGDHQASATESALDVARAQHFDLAGLLWAGGSEKSDPTELQVATGLPMFRGDSLDEALVGALNDLNVDVVIDLSDDPVLTPTIRATLMARALSKGVGWVCADSEVRPPTMFDAPAKPTIAVYATGKRVGKTAAAQSLALHLRARGFNPVIVAMGRGGPPEPVVIEAGAAPSLDELVAISQSGGHAASDYIEDAVVTGCTTIGCRRVGGGLAGAVWTSTVERGLKIASERAEDFVIVEGSGSAIPPVKADARLLVVGSGGLNRLTTGLGALWVHLADVAVVVDNSDNVRDHLAQWNELSVIDADLVPRPLQDVRGLQAIFATTAKPQFLKGLVKSLRALHGPKVVASTVSLSEPQKLLKEFQDFPQAQVLITELKGAAVSVAVDEARKRNIDVVLYANEVSAPDLEKTLDLLIDSAVKGAQARTQAPQAKT